MPLSRPTAVVLLAVLTTAAGCGYNPKDAGNGIAATVDRGTVECLYAGCHDSITAETGDFPGFVPGESWADGRHGNPDNSPSAADTGDGCPGCHNPVEESRNDEAYLFTSGVTGGVLGTPGRPVVGCEACHGTGMSHYAYAHAGTAEDADPVIYDPPYDPALGDTHYLPDGTAYRTFANPYHTTSCGPCHSPSWHAGGASADNILANQYAEWWGQDGAGILYDDGHSDSLVVETKQGMMTSAVRGTPCAACHTVEGFVTWFAYSDTSWAASQAVIDRLVSETGDADLDDPSILPGTAALAQVSCVACHPAHEPGILIRSVPRGLVSGTQRSEALCMACHNVRGLAADAGSGQSGTSSLEIPRHPQKEMFQGLTANEGLRGVEFAGFAFTDSAHAGTAIEAGCAGCHYFRAAEADLEELPTKATTGHAFRPRLENCLSGYAGCHVIGEFYLAGGDQASYEDSTISTFDFGAIYYSGSAHPGADYDLDGTVEPLQTEIQGMLAKLKGLLPEDDFDPKQGVFDLAQMASRTATTRGAAYNYDYVVGDGSLGYHNPIYTVNLLAASLSVLQ